MFTHRSKTIKLTFATFFLFASFNATSAGFNKIFSVSDGFTYNNQPAVSISFGEKETEYCSLTLLKKDIYTGFTAKSFRKKNKNIDIDCSLNGAYFVRSSKHKTGLKITIHKIDDKNQQADISIKLKLIDPSKNDLATLETKPLLIKGEFYKQLMAGVKK